MFKERLAMTLAGLGAMFVVFGTITGFAWLMETGKLNFIETALQTPVAMWILITCFCCMILFCIFKLLEALYMFFKWLFWEPLVAKRKEKDL